MEMEHAHALPALSLLKLLETFYVALALLIALHALAIQSTAPPAPQDLPLRITNAFVDLEHTSLLPTPSVYHA